MTAWALPENIEDVLPIEAAKLERSRRIALDTFASHGYELVVPPLLEYVESLLSGVGQDMNLATFKLVDQLSGRMMGIRADTTPQVARIDAHVLNRGGVTRLCYAGSVLHTRPAGLGKSRQPFQAGAELYGHARLDADIEIQQLMLDTLAAIGVRAVKLDIGHSEIFRGLVEALCVTEPERESLFAGVTGKDVPMLTAFAARCGRDQQPFANAIALLPTLYGGSQGVIAKARVVLPNNARIDTALNQLEAVAAHFASQSVTVSIDLGELGGFNYESGIAFAAFAEGASEAVARGGRYDDIGRVFGRARPATGFSMDLKSLLPLVSDTPSKPAPILVLQTPDAAAQAKIAALRRAGEIVIGHLESADVACDRELKFIDGQWQVVARL